MDTSSQAGLKIGAKEFIKLLNMKVRPWLEGNYPEGNSVFQQDSVPGHKAKAIQRWLRQHFADFWAHDCLNYSLRRKVLCNCLQVCDKGHLLTTFGGVHCNGWGAHDPTDRLHTDPHLYVSSALCGHLRSESVLTAKSRSNVTFTSCSISMYLWQEEGREDGP